MEVHHHAQTPRKKISHYVFEFLMLFLAVFLGYLAENGREHRVEHKRERELMVSLLHDLRADIRHIDSLKQKRLTRNDSCDLLISMLSDPGSLRKNGSTVYFYGRTASRRIHFRPQDGVLQQLRNSGGFRVIHDPEVLADVNAYELDLKSNQENIEVEEKELSEYTGLAARVFDVKIFQDMTRNNRIDRPAGDPLLLTYDPAILNELAIKLHYWKRTSISAIEILDQLRGTANRLIQSISEEYHLK
jgi:hypothetical protein